MVKNEVCLMVKRNLLILSLCLFLISCIDGTDESATTSSAESSFVPTSEIIVDITFNEIRFRDAVTDEELKVGEGDTLQVNADGIPVPVTEVQRRTCNFLGQACRYVYHYRIEYPADIFGGYYLVFIEFIRNNDVSALNTIISLPILPIYSSPSQNSTFSMANDDIPISVYHASYYATYTLAIKALMDTGVACVSRSYTLNAGQSDFIIPAGTLSDTADCLGNVTETSIHVITRAIISADPAFSAVYYYDTHRDDGISITLTP